jgi:cysteine synthase
MIEGYGAEVVKTPGSESDVKEIYDRVRALRAEPHNCVLNQFEEFGNYRFHFVCTSAAVLELARALRLRVGAFVSAIGSGGTIAAGEAIQEQHPGAATVAVEPVQCPTLYDAGFGSHRIEGIGDKHVTWIHNVWATDLLVCVDDQECLEGLQLLQEGTDTLVAEGINEELARSWIDLFGVSGVANVLGAIKAARYYGTRPEQGIFTVATDGFDRYPSVLRRLDDELGRMGAEEARRRLSVFTNQKLDHVLEGTRAVRRRWHNQKYYTWVEQQGRSAAELREQEDPAFWTEQQAKAAEMDRAIRQRRSEAP